MILRRTSSVDPDVEREFIRAMVERARRSIAANLSGVAILFAACLFLPFGKALAVALLFRLTTILLTWFNTRALGAALASGADPTGPIERFAVGMMLAGMSWGGLLWAIPPHDFATLPASLVRSVVLVGVALVTLTAAPVPRVMRAFLVSFVIVAGASLFRLAPEFGFLPLAIGAAIMTGVAVFGVGLSREAGRSAAVLVENQRLARVLQTLNAELNEAFERAELLARFDPLTGLANRRSFDEETARVGVYRKPGESWQLLLLDIDHFKAINDRAGHACGDTVLRAAGDLLGGIAASLPPGTTAARIGGEEFALLVPAISAAEARDLGQLICDRFRLLDAPAALGRRISVSIGVSSWADGEDIAALLRRADAALYDAKDGGRDQVRSRDVRTIAAA